MGNKTNDISWSGGTDEYGGEILHDIDELNNYSSESKPIKELPPEKKEELQQIMGDWIHGQYHDISAAFSGENLQIINDNLKSTNKTLYRAERIQHTANGLQVGDTLTFNDELKSFSKDIDGINDFISHNFNVSSEIVIFRTHGQNQIFDVGQLSSTKDWSTEHEVFVKNKNWKIDRISTLSGGPTVKFDDNTETQLYDFFYINPLVIDISPR